MICLAACKGGKKPLKADDKVDVQDLISFFDETSLPLTLTDTLFKKMPNDSFLIEAAVFSQFINDSIFKPEFGKNIPKVYQIGTFANGKKETYLIFRAVHDKKQHVYAAALDEKKIFKAAMDILPYSGTVGRNKVTIDNKFGFSLWNLMKGSDGANYPVSKVCAYNTAGLFMVILTDGLPPGVDVPIFDPIDTLPKKGKFAGNYEKDKRNFISIRDSKTPQQFMFFVYTEKRSTNSHGELKGEATMIGKDSAFYKGTGDPCAIGFKFGANSIHITEANCGNRHDVDCSFDGSYPKRKVVTPKVEKPVVKKKK